MLNFAGRESDKIKIFRKWHKTPIKVFSLFMFGIISCFVGGSFALSVTYGYGSQIFCLVGLGLLYLMIFPWYIWNEWANSIDRFWYKYEHDDFLKVLERVIELRIRVNKNSLKEM